MLLENRRESFHRCSRRWRRRVEEVGRNGNDDDCPDNDHFMGLNAHPLQMDTFSCSTHKQVQTCVSRLAEFFPAASRVGLLEALLLF
mmetsp:Transcript_24822/g.35528  ORF Transcript_24822/g.35528 Transcript_24822/m.35528 type:complete len:87 (+) Transcript_24822:414-674(+)